MTMRYVGGLHLGRAELIERVARALRPSAGTSWRLVVHAPPADRDRLARLEAACPDVVAGPALSPGEVPGVLVGSDALLFMESSDPAIFPFTRLSVSTKVPEYLATGRPVLVVGPESQASVRALLSGERAWYGGDGTSRADLARALASVAAAGLLTPHQPQDSDLLSTFDGPPTRERLRSVLAEAAIE